MENIDRITVGTFNVIVTNSTNGEIDTSLVDIGIITDFVPTREQKKFLRSYFKPLPLKTMFSREERESADILQLINKQVLHYYETYGLDKPGLFNLEFEGGTTQTFRFIRGISQSELQELVLDLIYSNKPIKDVNGIKSLIDYFDFAYDVNKIQNNEMRILLYKSNHIFNNGDDAVRYICYVATGSTLLIKSDEVINAVHAHKQEFDNFLAKHQKQLAQVFNRHKKIIMSLKYAGNRSVINSISRLSKTMHVPLKPQMSKNFINLALNGKIGDYDDVLSKIPLRDKLKYLNLLEWKARQLGADFYIIRNGKIHTEYEVKTYDTITINMVASHVLRSIKRDLLGLLHTNILLDPRVKYGLPTSQKQMVGKLPFGTRIVTDSRGEISAGIYWEDDWGAYDLDLSAIDLKGNRTGWGQLSGYNKNNPVAFSGDITSAPDGAMEFITTRENTFGLFVNIYSGSTNCDMELVIGENANPNRNWITNPIIREKHTLASRGMVLGFVRNNEFIVYSGRLNNNSANFDGKSIIVEKALCDMWTINRLLATLAIPFDLEKQPGVRYDHNLTYSEFSIDKLEELLGI